MTATNTTTTAATTRANMGASTVLDGFLKDVYLPGITNTLYFDDAFSRTIQSRSDIVDFEGRRVVRAFETQYGGGVGPIQEGGDFRPSVPAKGKQGYESIVYDNLYFALSGPTVKTVNSGRGSYVDAVTRHVRDVGRKAKLHFERQCVGEQNGRLAIHSDADVTGTAQTTAFDVTGDAFFDTMFLLPGEEIEFHAPVNGTATLRTAIDGTNAYTSIYSIYRKGSKKTGSVTRGQVIYNDSLSANVTQNDWITLRNAYDSADTAGTCLEMNGLRNLVTDGTDHSGDTYGVDESTGTNYTHTWHLAVADYDWLKSYVKNVGADLDEEGLLEAMIELQVTYGGNPNMLIVSHRQMLDYFMTHSDDRRFNLTTAMEWVGGYKGLGIQLGNKQLMLTALNSCPSNFAFMINTGDFAFARATNGYEWLTGEGGAILKQKESSDNQYATAVDYRQLVCFDPQKQCKLYGITE